MFNLIFSILGLFIVSMKYYDWIRYRQKPDSKTIIVLLLATAFVILTLLEKVLKIKLDGA